MSHDPCPFCKGSGTRELFANRPETAQDCTRCGGTGDAVRCFECGSLEHATSEHEACHRDVIGPMSQYTNIGGNPELFAACVTSEHRTLQQGMMRLFTACIEKWAEQADKGQYDLRNEATVKLCKKIVEATGDKYDRGLPLV